MKLILSLTFLIAAAAPTFGQVDDPLAFVRDDFHEASVVVRMNITDTKPTGPEDSYYYGFIASGRVTQAFKGTFRAGQAIEFYVRAENGYRHPNMRGDKIAFLTSFVNRRDGPFQELPHGNSVDAYSPGLLSKVRTVWREWHKRRNYRGDRRRTTTRCR